MTENTVWKNCVDIYESGERKDGIYIIDPDGQGSFEVKCLMTLDEGGWTVIQRRQDGSEDFYRNWTAYKDGFGNLTSEFWLGLDKIHRLTSSGENTMRIDMTSWDDKEYFVEYGSFSILDEADEYQLNIASYTAGNEFIFLILIISNLIITNNNQNLSIQIIVLTKTMLYGRYERYEELLEH